jgi:hypothetical protein
MAYTAAELALKEKRALKERREQSFSNTLSDFLRNGNPAPWLDVMMVPGDQSLVSTGVMTKYLVVTIEGLLFERKWERAKSTFDQLAHGIYAGSHEVDEIIPKQFKQYAGEAMSRITTAFPRLPAEYFLLEKFAIEIDKGITNFNRIKKTEEILCDIVTGLPGKFVRSDMRARIPNLGMHILTALANGEGPADAHVALDVGPNCRIYMNRHLADCGTLPCPVGLKVHEDGECDCVAQCMDPQCNLTAAECKAPKCELDEISHADRCPHPACRQEMSMEDRAIEDADDCGKEEEEESDSEKTDTDEDMPEPEKPKLQIVAKAPVAAAAAPVPSPKKKVIVVDPMCDFTNDMED